MPESTTAGAGAEAGLPSGHRLSAPWPGFSASRRRPLDPGGGLPAWRRHLQRSLWRARQPPGWLRAGGVRRPLRGLQLAQLVAPLGSGRCRHRLGDDLQARRAACCCLRVANTSWLWPLGRTATQLARSTPSGSSRPS